MTEIRRARPTDEPARDTTLDESGTLLGERYRLLRPLGEGGAGIVYAATDERIGAEVAIKVVRGSARSDEVTLARFHREARAAGKLGHPNIVRVTDFGTSSGGSPYVVMERLDGETLEARIARGRVDVSTAIDVHVQLADALAAAHAAGVLHRDVKPANVFLMQLATGKLLVKLLDFGLAELYEEPGSPRLTERGLLVGSLAYLAPERILGAAADERSDVYAIGASLHECLTGELPFSAPNSMMLRAKILEGALEASLAPLEPALAEVVRLCLSRDPDTRLPSAAEVRRRLLVAGEPPRAERPTAPAAEVRAPMTMATTSPRLKLIALSIAIASFAGLAVALASGGAEQARSDEEAPIETQAPPAAIQATAPTPSAPTPTAPTPPAPTAPAPTAETSRTISAPRAEAPSPVTKAAPAHPPPAPERAREPRPRPPREAPLEATSPLEPATAPAEPPAEPRPSRFDHVQEPDWGAPIPG